MISQNHSHLIVSLLLIACTGHEGQDHPDPSSSGGSNDAEFQVAEDRAGNEESVSGGATYAAAGGASFDFGEAAGGESSSITSGGMAGITSGGTAGVTTGGMAGASGVTDAGGGRPGELETASGGMASGGSDAGSEPSSSAPKLANAALFLNDYCSSSSCHGGKTKPTLSNNDALTNTLATYTVKACGDVPLVVPGNPEGSSLYMVLAEGCGKVKMPAGCGSPPCYDEQVMGAFYDWISRDDPFE